MMTRNWTTALMLVTVCILSWGSIAEAADAVASELTQGEKVGPETVAPPEGTDGFLEEAEKIKGGESASQDNFTIAYDYTRILMYTSEGDHVETDSASGDMHGLTFTWLVDEDLSVSLRMAAACDITLKGEHSDGTKIRGNLRRYDVELGWTLPSVDWFGKPYETNIFGGELGEKIDPAFAPGRLSISGSMGLKYTYVKKSYHYGAGSTAFSQRLWYLGVYGGMNMDLILASDVWDDGTMSSLSFVGKLNVIAFGGNKQETRGGKLTNIDTGLFYGLGCNGRAGLRWDIASSKVAMAVEGGWVGQVLWSMSSVTAGDNFGGPYGSLSIAW